MSTDNITTNNVIIAKFMDNWTDSGLEPAFFVYNHKGYEAHELKFHDSWDWLMPVVKKINDLCYPNEDDGCIDSLSEQGNDLVFDIEGSNYFGYNAETIESLHKICIKFIKWYNKNYKK